MSSDVLGLPCAGCRERRVKCDKRRPGCLRCEKRSQLCPGYTQKRQFLDEGPRVRKKYPHHHSRQREDYSFASDSQISSISVSDFQQPNVALSPVQAQGDYTDSARPSIDRPVISTESTPWVDQSAVDTSIRSHVVGYYMPMIENDTDSVALHTGLEQRTLYMESDYFDLDPEEFYATHINNCGFIPYVPSTNEDDELFMSQYSTAPSGGLISFPASTLEHTSPSTQSDEIIHDDNEHEIAFLTRRFTEIIGPWLDLYDSGRYFGTHVPIKALRNALLRYALVAAAAKQLGRVSKNLSQHRAPRCPSRFTETDKNADQVDWFYKAAAYYDKALSQLRTHLYCLSDGSGSSFHGPDPFCLSLNISGGKDDLLAAISIFSVYEILSNFEAEWLHHLSGFQSLLGVNDKLHLSWSPTAGRVTNGQRAAFWNFAKDDYVAAYIYGTSTRLDTEDLDMWRAYGLQVTNGGILYTQVANGSSATEEQPISVDLVCHTLVWIVLRVMNFVAATTDAPNGIVREDSSTDPYSCWSRLQEQLDNWYKTLPAYFQPCAKLKHIVPETYLNREIAFNEVFFSIAMCAAALQLYHFTAILLLLNKPNKGREDRKALGDTLRWYRESLSKCALHSREICGVSLARPDTAVRMQMSMPLYIAGLCLEAPSERKIILNLLRDIEEETGFSTKKRVDQLLSEWNVEKGSLVDCE